MKTLEDYIEAINELPRDALHYTAPEAMESKVWDYLRWQGWKNEDLVGKFSLWVERIDEKKKEQA